MSSWEVADRSHDHYSNIQNRDKFAGTQGFIMPRCPEMKDIRMAKKSLKRPILRKRLHLQPNETEMEISSEAKKVNLGMIPYANNQNGIQENQNQVRRIRHTKFNP